MKILTNKLLFIIALPIVIILLCSVKGTKEDNILIANKLKLKYAESSAVNLTTERDIKFDLDKEKVNVIESYKGKIISLRIDNEIKRTILYDINSKISEQLLTNERNRYIDVVPTCGNYEKDDIFHSDHMICVYPLQFEKLGDIQIFSYEKETDDIRYFTSVYFQSDIPVQTSKIVFTVPSWLDLELKEMNFSNYKIEKTIKKDERKGTTTFEYTASDLDEFKNEANSFGISHTYPHILIVSKSYKDKEGKKVNIISNIDDLHSWYNQLVNQLKNENSVFKPTVDKLTANARTDLDKIKSIYYWVQDNIRYIAFENGIAGYKPAEASQVYTQKYGDCKGMANLLKWMLKTAGFDARLAWIGTNDIPYSYNIPSLAINNHMICCVKVAKQLYYLDATDKFLGFNDYSERIQGRIVMVEEGNKYFLDTIPVYDKNRNLNTVEFNLKINNNALTGKCKQNYQGESHQSILYMINNLQKEKQKEFKEFLINVDDKNIVADNINCSDINDKDNPYNIEADVTINNMLSNFDNDYYLDLDFYKNFNNSKIKEDRKSDVFFNEKKYMKIVVNVAIPAGMKIKYMPAPLDIKENQFNFSIKYTTNNKVITYERIISIDNGIIPKSDIGKWNNAIKQLTEKYNDNMILTKI